MKKRVFIYIRVSTDAQAEEGYSLGEQEERLRKYCEAMGWVLVRVFTDGGFSGANMDRPALQEMFKELEKGSADIVLVDKLDRLSRSQFDTLYMIQNVFDANGVAFVSRNEAFDTSTPFGKAMVGILAVFAELERARIKERMADGRAGRAKEGKWKGGSAPAGYDYNPETGFLAINKYEAEQVKMVFEMFNSRLPIYTIMNRMNDNGYRLKSGAWTEGLIRYVVESRVYLGEMRWKDEWVQGGHPAIIADEVWERASVILEERNKQNEKYKPGRRYTSPFGGLIRCGNCGAKYHCRTAAQDKNGNARRYYMCYSRAGSDKRMVRDPNCKNKNYRDKVLEEILYNEIRKLKADPLYISNVRSSVDQTALIQQAENRVEAIGKQMAKMMDLYSIGAIDLTIIKEKMQKLADEKQALEAEVIERKGMQTARMTNDEVVHFVDLFEKALQSGDNALINNAVSEIIEYIEIDGEDIKIHWNF